MNGALPDVVVYRRRRISGTLRAICVDPITLEGACCRWSAGGVDSK